MKKIYQIMVKKEAYIEGKMVLSKIKTDEQTVESECLKIYEFDDGMPFAVVWYNQEDILPYMKDTMEVFNEYPVIKEVTDHNELKGWQWGLVEGDKTVILNGVGILDYLLEKGIRLEEPLLV